MDFLPFLIRAESGATLTRSEMREAMDALLKGAIADDEIERFLRALKARGETVDEIVAAAEAMRARAVCVSAPVDAIDTCGTGGDGADTFNISTAAALVVAGCGVPVAKHGNKSASSRSGSSEVLERLGVNLNATPETISRCINEAKIGFMFAAYHHRAVGHVAAVRKRIGARTIFNALGPLANPAGAKRQLMGVYDRALVEPLAHALRELGSTRAMIVHGGDGLDELTTTGPSFVSELKDGAVLSYQINPADAGFEHAETSALKGGEPEENAAALMQLLEGKMGAYRDITALNAAAALMIADRARDLKEGAALAAQSIDHGHAMDALSRLVRISNEGAQ